METRGRLLTMGANTAAMNMAIDEVLLRSLKDTPIPTLRFYAWSTPAFSFGYFQDIAAAVDVEACRADGIALVKRMTGGGIVVHGWELTYTLLLPRGGGEIGVSEMYRKIGGSLANGFQQLGVPARCYEACPEATERLPNICLSAPAPYDVMLDNRKVAGVSVRRTREGFMFQGYIALEMPPAALLAHLTRDPAVAENTTALNRDGRSISRNVLIRVVCETLEIGVAFKPDTLSQTELSQAETLVRTKYGTRAWNFE